MEYVVVNIKEWLFLNWIRIQPSLVTWLYRNSGVCGYYYFRMVDVLGNKNLKYIPLDLSCNVKDKNDY